jgi:hypothetical protein
MTILTICRDYLNCVGATVAVAARKLGKRLA